MVGNPEFRPVGSFRWRKIKSTEVEVEDQDEEEDIDKKEEKDETQENDYEENKLASLEATQVRNSAHPLTYSLTGVKCRATSVAKKGSKTSAWVYPTLIQP